MQAFRSCKPTALSVAECVCEPLTMPTVIARTSTKARLLASQTMLVSATSRGGRVRERSMMKHNHIVTQDNGKAIDDAHTSVVSLTSIGDLCRCVDAKCVCMMPLFHSISRRHADDKTRTFLSETHALTLLLRSASARDWRNDS
jgi:hypothetical protein